MLVLTRKVTERLYIGDEICVTVVRLEGNQVRLGIEAPRHVPVIREELLDEPVASPVPAFPTINRPLRQRVARQPALTAHGNGNRRRGPSR